MHYRMTDRTRVYEGKTLYQIQATEDLPHPLVTEGSLGGWIEKESNLTGKAWVHKGSIVMEDAVVKDEATIATQSVVRGSACVSGKANVRLESLVCGKARVYGEALVRDRSVIKGNAEIKEKAFVTKSAVSENAIIKDSAELIDSKATGRALICGDAFVGGQTLVSHRGFITEGVVINGLISEPQHILHIGPIGSESRYITAYRTDSIPRITIGCWSGDLYKMQEEVLKRSLRWKADKATKNRWLYEYELAYKLIQARARIWE